MVSIAIGVGGMIGALLRYYVGVSFHYFWLYSFPLGTLIINYAGCFILSWFTYRVSQSSRIFPWFRSGFGTGLVGAFTTFSTFSVETLHLFQKNLVLLGFLYIFLSLIGGLAMSWLGDTVSKTQFKRKRERTHLI